MSRPKTNTIILSVILLLVVVLGIANLYHMRATGEPGTADTSGTAVTGGTAGGGGLAKGSQTAPPAKPTADAPKPPPPERIQQTYLVGRTYHMVTTFKLNARGMQREWGITVNSNILYHGEVELSRKIKSNDGTTIVLDQKFVRAENIRIATQIENVNFEDLGTAGELALAALDWVGTAEWDMQRGWTQGAREGLQFVANQPTVKDFLGRVATDATAKVMATVDDLQGKEVEIRWTNGKIADVKPLTPGWNPSNDQDSFIKSLSIAPDASILPDPLCKTGTVWSIDGRDLVPCFDPSLHAMLAGRVNVERAANSTRQGVPHAVIQTQPNGHLEMRGWDENNAYLGDWYPEGNMYFSFQDNIVTAAEFRGRFSAHGEATNYWFFKTEFTVTPEYRINYTCELKP